jgi:hypothetical protein
MSFEMQKQAAFEEMMNGGSTSVRYGFGGKEKTNERISKAKRLGKIHNRFGFGEKDGVKLDQKHIAEMADKKKR